MSKKEKVFGDVAVIYLSGKLMGGEETSEVHEHVKGLIADKIKKVVIDLSKVKWMNSQGIGMLMACHSSLSGAGGGLKVSSAAEKVNSLLIITQVISIFKNYDKAEDAVAAFNE